jgi:AcrR family transcriptional regulator
MKGVERSTRERVVLSAVELFAKKGFEATSMREIAEAAGVTKPMIYYHFKNKEDLYFSILDTSLDRFTQTVRAAVEGEAPPEEKLQKIVATYVRHFEEENDIFRLVNREVMGGGKHLDYIVDKYFSKLHSGISGVIARGSREGTFKGVDPYMAALSVIGIILFYFNERRAINRLAGEEAQVEKMIDSLKSHILTLLAKS